MSDTEKIDFVIIWVDGSDPEWRAEKDKYDTKKKTNANSEVRYRDWDNLQYWFRGVEKFAPWVNKIHFVTWGHLPKWLDTTNPKLHIVNHKDYIPQQYLPTFSANPIELNLHRIEGLAEQFVFFNDDMFLTAPVSPGDFFVNGKPCDTFALDCINFAPDTAGFINGADLTVINAFFDKKSVCKKNKKLYLDPKNGIRNIMRTLLLSAWGYFPGFYYQHVPAGFLKSTYNTVWEKAFDTLDTTCHNKFRTPGDVNQWVMKFWQLASGNFKVRKDSFALCYHLKENNYQKLLDDIPSKNHCMICINDTADTLDFEGKKEGVKQAFEKLLPDKCSFEL